MGPNTCTARRSVRAAVSALSLSVLAGLATAAVPTAAVAAPPSTNTLTRVDEVTARTSLAEVARGGHSWDRGGHSWDRGGHTWDRTLRGGHTWDGSGPLRADAQDEPAP